MAPIRKLTFFAIMSVALIPAQAMAKKGGNDNGRGHSHGYEDSARHHSDHDGDVTIAINFGDREIIENYLAGAARRDCPPGLAKKNPPCIPPGQAKKWRIGYPLPDDVVFVPISGDLLGRLHPLPYGYQYVQVDKDVLLIAEASKKVIDAVTLLSAVGN